MTATYTWDVFTTLDGFGSYSEDGDWGGYWGKEGPELTEHRFHAYDGDQRMVFGATTFRANVEMLGSSPEPMGDEETWVDRMKRLPTIVVSSTLTEPLDWPNATVAAGDAVEIVRQLKEESDVPLRSHGSISLNLALMAAGLVDVVQVTLFPVVSGQTGTDPIFGGAADFDLELLGNQTFDGRSVELHYRPTLHG